MTIAEIEQAIIERLKAKVQGVLVEGFPEKPYEFNLLHSKGALLVRYVGSRFSEPEATDLIVQTRRIEFEVVVVMRHLRTHEGAYSYLDAVRIALTGYKIPGCSKMYPVREEFISEEAGIWQYAITFAMTAPAFEIDEAEQPVLLRKITTIDGYGTVVVEKK